jgi:NTP pyrophosphatase (non-canonical NTP hydrolase)
MNSKDYQENTLITDLMDYGPVIERLSNIHTVRLLHAAMGLCTEAGEFMDMLKKHILYGKPLDEINLKEELGDKLWYTALALDELKSTFDQCMETNIEKLRARYPNKFTEHDALNRDLTKERKILEREMRSPND